MNLENLWADVKGLESASAFVEVDESWRSCDKDARESSYTRSCVMFDVP